MARIANGKCDLGDRHVGAEKKNFGTLDPSAQDEPMRRDTHGLAEGLPKVMQAKSGYAGQHCQAEIVRKMSLDIVDHLP
nr:hypothetical protein [Croceicoccus estronivorus]